MTTFAQAFREHVIPDILRMIESHAVDVVWERLDFSEAINAAETEARRRGLCYLEDFVIDDFHDWVLATLTTEVARHIPAVQQAWDAERERWVWIAGKISAAHDYIAAHKRG